MDCGAVENGKNQMDTNKNHRESVRHGAEKEKFIKNNKVPQRKDVWATRRRNRFLRSSIKGRSTKVVAGYDLDELEREKVNVSY